MNLESIKDEVQFIFSEDCPFERRNRFIGATGTAVFWFILMIFLAVSPGIKKQKKYKEIQIVLSETPSKKIIKKEQSAPPAPSAAPKQENSAPVEETPLPPPPAPAKKSETPVKKTEAPKASAKKETPAKTTPSKKPAAAPVPKAPEVVEYAVDPMEAFAKQTAPKKTKEFDWSQFDDEAVTSSSSSNSENYVTGNSTIAGTAATGTNTQNQKQTSQTADNNSKSKTAASSTSSALGRIANTTFVGNSSSSIKSEVYVDAVTGANGKVSVKMTDGTSRALIDPASPVINLSDEASALIDGTKTVKIEFDVVASGNVPFSKVSITPQAVLPSLVRMEIIDQISTWRFESASTTSTAVFEYTIVKR